MDEPKSTPGIEPPQSALPVTGVPGGLGLAEPHAHGLDRLHVLYKYRKVVIAATLLALLAGIVQTYTTPTAYMGTAVVRAEPDSPQVIATQGAPGARDPDSFMQSELSVIHSRDLKRRVVQTLRLDRNPQFETARGTGGLERGFAALRSRITKPIQGMLSSARSPGPAVAPPNLEQVETPAETRAIETIAANLEIQPQRASHLFAIRFSSSSAQLSANIANALAIEYTRDIPERSRQRIQDQMKVLTGNLEQLSARIEADQWTLAGATPDAAAVGDDVIARIVANAQADLVSKRSARLAAEEKARAMEALDSEHHPDSAETYPDVLSSTAVLRQQIATLKLDRRKVISEGVGPDNVLVKAIDSHIAHLEQDLKAEIRGRIEAARQDYAARLAEERTADRILTAQRNLQVQNSRTGISYNALKQDINTSIKLRDDVATRQRDLELVAKETSSRITIVDYAQPPQRPYKPDTSRNILISLAIGLALGLTLAFGLDRLDDTIKTPEDVTRKLHIPFLGLVPSVGVDRQPVLSGPVPHDFGEAYRVLRTSLVFTSGAETTRIITVTSAQPLEGKTTTACNLALVLAFGGSRVLLIDADMRRPGVHKTLKMANTIGLSHLLVGQARVREAIQRTSDPNLCVMTAGRTPPNPSELLASERLKQLVANLKQGPFDWVVIDTPPVLAVTDAVLLTPLVDGVTFVLGAEMTRRGLAERAVQMLMTGRPKVLGAVLNRVSFERDKYYYSRYYGYRYKSYSGTEPTAATNATT